ncbi:ornithine carbamoyltransferase [Dermatobacter hominis]|uniref:ornithine carbamoyltransferase n=1 Tax=Dermatobacter hominis TaxID=2884263 RepID=UPI001D126CBF|nr:ornithine carbamoyltransferase [Dermatobacter hominis]UDY36227.1 ornithine carbamoyltransferase [Dermatobacter hominis]
MSTPPSTATAVAPASGTTPRHLLEVDDLTTAELLRILDLSELADPPKVLAGSGGVLLFEKPSARTRTSMEMAIVQVGGHPVTLTGAEVGIDTRETAEDLGRLMSGFGGVIGARVFEHHKLERMAAASSVPVVNLLSDDAHPVQTLADLLTLRQCFGRLDGLTVAYVGDANNVARSLGIGCGLAGVSFRLSSPPGYRFDEGQLDRIRSAGTDVTVVDDPYEAVAGADAVYTDAWYSMGQEEEQRVRREAFDRWRVDEAMMAAAGPDAVFLHCLPAHRGDEATDGVLDGPQSRIWPQAHNRMHSARGLLVWLGAEARAAG